MSKEKILLIMPSVPFPERKDGLAIRYFPIIERLSKLYLLDGVVLLSTGEVGVSDIDGVSSFFNRMHIIRMETDRKVTVVKRFKYLFSIFSLRAAPANIYSYHGRENAQEIALNFELESYKKIIFVTLRTSHTLQHLLDQGLNKRKVVIDIVDSGALAHTRSNKSKSLMGRLAQKKILNWEVKVINSCSKVMYIASQDRDYISDYISDKNKLIISPNGVYVEGMHARLIKKPKLPVIGFLGSMNYPPNINGALFAYEVYKEFTHRYKKIEYHIIGRDPVEPITSLTNDSNVIVTGSVDDIWEYVNAVDIFVIMLFDGSGQQNKLLEIMSASKVVIANDIANAGIGAVHGKHLLIAKTCDDCVEHIDKLLTDKGYREGLAEAGRCFIESNFSWDSKFPIYLNIIES